MTGLVAAAFRIALEHGDRWRNDLIERMHQSTIAGFLLVVVVTTLAATVASWMVKRFCSHASGSGIPHVEAVVHGELPPANFWLLPVKFAGGWLAIGAGLALGREGPTVQMGASIGHLFGSLTRRSWADVRVLMAAGAGAGLAAAFNAPLAGAVFVLEELVRSFETRLAIAALGASAGAIFVARLLIGDEPDFVVAPIAGLQLHLGTMEVLHRVTMVLLLGVVAGLAGVAYNRSLLLAMKIADRIPARAAVVGASIGIIAWFAPGWVGGGDALTQRALDGGGASALVLGVFALRFVLGPASYAAGTPGGLFAPMLVLGAQLGLMCGGSTEFAIIGMAAFFTAVVRAPVTGIVLVSEMTGNTSLLVGLAAASFVAMAVATALRSPPVYDSLKQQAVDASRRMPEDHS
jgi:CIC family chloride channel protein